MPNPFNEAIIRDFHEHGGKVTNPNFANSDLLLLTTSGAKTSQPHTTPLVYTQDGGKFVVIASKGGAPSNPQWYNNLVKNPVVMIEIGTEKLKAKATPIESGSERDRLFEQHASRYPGFNNYKTKAAPRIIPVVLLEKIIE